MSEHGHAAVELALGIGALLLPAALVVTSFGPWLETRVFAEATAAEAARATVIDLDHRAGVEAARSALDGRGLTEDLVSLSFCGGPASPLDRATSVCPLDRGSSVVAAVSIWTPLFTTPWGEIGGLWVTGEHAEPVDLYRSLG